MSLKLTLSLTGKKDSVYFVEVASIKIGSSHLNDIIINLEGIDPLHAIIEIDQENWIISNISDNGQMIVNGKSVTSEVTINYGDIIEIADAKITCSEADSSELSKVDLTVDQEEKKSKEEEIGNILKKASETRRREDLLFTPRDASSSGGTLEVINYWDERILDIEHFHPSLKGYETVTVGDPQLSHFLSSGAKVGESFTLAEAQETGFTLHLKEGMTARLKRKGGWESAGPGTYELERREIAHVRHGNSRFFMIFMGLPELKLPRPGPEDPFFLGLNAVLLSLYLVLSVSFFFTEPLERHEVDDELWNVVELPKKIEESKQEVKKLKKDKPKEKPKPKPKPVKPVKAKESPKPKPKKEKKKPSRANESLTKAKTQKQPPKKAKPKKQAGSGEQGNKRKGNQKTDTAGAKNVENVKSSGINLSKLGLGVGKVSSKTGVGAIATKFKDTSGGAGGGSGSAKKTFGLGGISTNGKALGLTGSKNAAEQFGDADGIADGDLDATFKGKKSSADVDLRAGDPVIAGGLSQEEILHVVRLNQNQIKHCYERLLQRSPNSSGRIKIKFVVGVNGRVGSTSVSETSIADKSLQDCVMGSIRRWKFPEPRGGAPVTVSYPWEFSALDI